MDRVWVNFAATAAALPRKARVLAVGNPTRGSGTVWRKRGADAPLRVLSFGGSLGADALNAAVLDLMEAERERGGICHLHATGRDHYEKVKAAFSGRGLDRDPAFALAPFVEDMPSRMAEAHLVICRAGAMSISELALCGRAALLVPSPNVTGDHQYKNAKVLADAGAAVLVEESALKSGALTATALALLAETERRQALERAITAFATPDANKRIYADICEIVGKSAEKP